MAVTYKTRGDSFVTSKPRIWARAIAQFTAARSYEPGPDGKHIIVLLPADEPKEPRNRVTFLLNFFDELQRRVP
jgi:hypothetical protein